LTEKPSCEAEDALPGAHGWSGLKPRVLADLAAAYAWAGRDGEARETIERLRKVDPHFTALTVQAHIDTQTNPTFQAQTARALEGMRRAGLPEE
jgi:hypothetical protein